MGFVSTAYSAQISPTIALSSRYGVNVYSYESDLSIGGEWWIGRRRGKRVESGTTPGLSAAVDPQPSRDSWKGPGEVEKAQGREAILEEGDLRRDHHALSEVPGPFAHERVYPVAAPIPTPSATPELGTVESTRDTAEDRDGILKAKISGNWVRLSPCLVESG